MNEPPNHNHFPREVEEKPALTKRELFSRYLRGIIALMTILGLVYISGLYQALLFQRTPEAAKQERLESAFDAEILTLPLQIFVLTSDGPLGSERSDADVRRLVKNASAVWDQADIELEIEELTFLKVSDDQIESLLVSPGIFVTNVPGYSNKSINVFLTKLLRGLNGIAFGGLRAVAVADFTTVYDFRALAHEIGHVLGLDHTSAGQNRLMFRGANGFELMLEEITQARQSALNQFLNI